ncbi:MAG: DUF4342 domain-containing protein [Chloroflexota bacterium]
MSDETIYIQDETGQRRTEEISVRRGDLADTLGRLAREATVRKITLVSAGGRVIAEIPLVLGAAGVLLLGPWTAAALAAALIGRVSILIEYEEAPATMQESVKQLSASLDDEADAIEANLKSA